MFNRTTFGRSSIQSSIIKVLYDAYIGINWLKIHSLGCDLSFNCDSKKA